jgi:hypothetical protein
MSGDTFWLRPLYGNILTPGGEIFNFDTQFLQAARLSVKPDDILVFDLDVGQIKVYSDTTPYALITKHIDFAAFDPVYDVATYSRRTYLFDVGVTVDDVNASGAVTYVGTFPYGAFINLGIASVGKDPGVDTDRDGVLDKDDNCPNASNTNQADFDRDGFGDACDADDDNDGVPDSSDEFPLDAAESADTDDDGMGDNFEVRFGLNLNDPADALIDNDSDGLSNLDEFQQGTNPLVNEKTILPIINSILEG